MPPRASPIPATSLVALRISEVVVHHADLDTAWTIEEADPDSLLNAVEAAVRAMRVREAPGMTLVTEERDEWVIGDGALRVESDREGLLDWLARGETEGVEADAEAFRTRFEEALASTEPLSTLERRARGGIVARQVTLR